MQDPHPGQQKANSSSKNCMQDAQLGQQTPKLIKHEAAVQKKELLKNQD